MSASRPAWWGSPRSVLLLFLPPALLLFTLLVAWPMSQAGWYSVFHWNGYGRPTDFAGLDNFRQLLDDADFLIALRNNGLLVATSLLVQLPLALGLALLLCDAARSTAVFRLVFFVPYMLAEVAAGLIWRFVFDGDNGLVAAAWRATAAWFGGAADATPQVLSEPAWAMAALLLVVVWKYFGFHMMLFIAGLQQIDRALYDAARIDGAGRWQVFTRITLPLLKPTLKLSVFFAILGSLQLFDLVMPLTQGGPSNSTHTLVSYLYAFGLTRMEIGYGSAVGVVLFGLCVAFAFGYRKWAVRDAG